MSSKRSFNPKTIGVVRNLKDAMNPANQLLERIEAGHLWAHFHKDWLL